MFTPSFSLMKRTGAIMVLAVCASTAFAQEKLAAPAAAAVYGATISGKE